LLDPALPSRSFVRSVFVAAVLQPDRLSLRLRAKLRVSLRGHSVSFHPRVARPCLGEAEDSREASVVSVSAPIGERRLSGTADRRSIVAACRGIADPPRPDRNKGVAVTDSGSRAATPGAGVKSGAGQDVRSTRRPADNKNRYLN